MDEQIGRLRDHLRELNIEEQTVVFFCSDNGPSDKLAKDGTASAGDFKGHKHKMYEGGLLVPACVEWPGKIKPGTTQVRCNTVDFFPTIANLVDYSFSKAKKRPIDGVDLMPVVEGEQSERNKPMFFGFRRLHQGIDGKAIIEGNWKLLREAKSGGRLRLYDISNDPYEKQDLSSAQPERLEKLTKTLEEIERSCQESRDGADYRY